MSVFREGLLEGRVALVTGGGSGIGAGIARMLARQGARVALMGRTEAKLTAVAGQIDREVGGERSHVAVADVRDYPAVERGIEATVARWGGLDVLVSSAAGNFLAPAAKLSANGFRAVVDIDLCGTFNACRAAFAHLAARRGCVVSISATQAFVPTPLQVHAGAAKAGIEKLTRDLALEWARSGVRVNTVIPGPIEGTEGMSRLGPSDDAAIAKAKQRVPLGRWGTIDEIADAVLFVVSPAGAYITGASLLVDGGTALTGSWRLQEMSG
jgi:2,4-dienoyl-CoA reductase [(3E)-enoyl-CoA-producing], peroxisomal